MLLSSTWSSQIEAGIAPYSFQEVSKVLTLPMTIDSPEQHPTFDEAVEVHCSKSPGITLFSYATGGD